MFVSRGWGRAAAVAFALAMATGARAAESGDRIGTVVASRIELQRQIGDWLTKCLAGTAEPYRVEAIVQLEMRGSIRELRSKQQSAVPSVKIGGKNRVKLPGLGMVDGGGQQNLMPEISIDGGARVSETVSRQIETEVARLKVMLFVDPSMPKERRQLLVDLVTDLAGIDRSRGDEVVTREWPETSKPAQGTVVQATLAPKLSWEVIAICLTGLVAAAIVALGIRGVRGGSTSIVGMGGGRAADGGANGANGAAAADGAAPGVSEEERKRREELGAFKALADATPKELVQVLAEVDPHTACAIADLVGFDAETAKLVETMLPSQRRVEIGIGLATSRILTREQLAHMESVAAQVFQRVRNRVPLGGPGRLAQFLALAPDAVRREVLKGVAARDPNVAREARQSMYLFEDLPNLSDATLRQVVTGIDPGLVALAVVGAPEIRELVYGAVSKRLRGILEVEDETVKDKPPAEVEGARRVLEDALRQLNSRGEIRARAA